MKSYKALILILILITTACENEPEIIAESWVNQPVKDWPDFALTNEISMNDTIFKDLANSFLVTTGKDTVGVSCKHIFALFENVLGFNSIDLGDRFDYWEMYPKNKPGKRVKIKKLINENIEEPIGPFNKMKDKDWIIFELNDLSEQLYPLKIRYTPVRKDEIVYAVGWGILQEDNTNPALIRLRCYKSLGNYYFMLPMKTDTKPNGRSGSPVIDRNGYLVGLVSGAEGNFAVIGSVQFLKSLLDRYGIEYDVAKAS